MILVAERTQPGPGWYLVPGYQDGAMPAYLDTSSRVTRFSNQTFGHLHTFVHLGHRSVRNIPPLLSVRLARAEREGRRPTTGTCGVAKTATGLPVGLHAEHMCITRRLRLGITRRSFGCGLYSHEPSLTAHGVSSNEVVCHATELVARPRYRSRRGALLSRLPSPGHALEGNTILQHRSCQWPGAWPPGRLVPGW